VSNDWVPISYIGFWDVPFNICFEHAGTKYLLVRGEFDEELDEYPDDFTIACLSDSAAAPRSNEPDDWNGIEEHAEPIGAVSRHDLKFDPTHRNYLARESVELILASIPS
jgi:hypothetical protein